ncbi:MAG: dihydrolipoamide dehydrogenase [Lentisphaerae bacterium ADurb.BinA184]|nr:MAG: dihydrolipoamide dehydrogenase [Lentisphaerae bacterium ADurb.BinA184]
MTTPAKKRIKPSAVVIGAGVAGAAATLELLNAGIGVTVVERDSCVGGQAPRFGCKATDACQHCNVCVAQEQVRKAFGPDSGARVLTDTQVTQCQPSADGGGVELLVTSGRGRQTRLRAAAVLAAVGYEPFDARILGPYGYGLIPNVVSGLDIERAHADGRAALTRPSDGQPARRIAFVQCVGSRSEQAHRTPEKTNYCSTVCCSYALRMGRLAQHLNPEAAVTVFYMDVQCFGRDFAEVYAACRKEMDFVMARPYGLQARPDGTVAVRYEEQAGGQAKEAEFDLVVLSVGIRPPAGGAALAEVLGIPLDEYGFLGAKSVLCPEPGESPRIFIAGACDAPRNIAQTIGHARAVAAGMIRLCEK